MIFGSGYHTLYQWYRSVESEHFPDPTGLRARMEQWTFGLYPACIKYLMSAFDVPEVINSLCPGLHFFLLLQYIHVNTVRSWLSPGAIFARKEWSHFLAGVLSYIMLPSFSISGSSQRLWSH